MPNEPYIRHYDLQIPAFLYTAILVECGLLVKVMEIDKASSVPSTRFYGFLS